MKRTVDRAGWSYYVTGFTDRKTFLPFVTYGRIRMKGEFTDRKIFLPSVTYRNIGHVWRPKLAALGRINLSLDSEISSRFCKLKR